MKEILRFARLYFVLLAIVTAGRWCMGFLGVPYDQGHHYFSLVILTVFSCIYYGAFARRWKGFSVARVMLLGVILGVATQLVILLSTLASYAFGVDSYFVAPRALNATAPLSLSEAVANRLNGLVANTFSSVVVAALGWALGGLLPGSGGEGS
jgi:hypothetical protein